MTNSAWFLLATPDVLTAQLIAQRPESFPSQDLEDTTAPRVARMSRRVTPLLRRFRTVAA